MLELGGSIAHVSTYPPRECGIATFTRDLARALMMRGHAKRSLIVAINERNGNLYSDPNVKFTIDQHDLETYDSAAEFLNESDVDVVSIQHEYGIFGGEWGEYILQLCRKTEKPFVCTFHTVLSKPPDKARFVLREIAEMSDSVIVTIESAANLLKEVYGVEQSKINVVRHGTALPDRVRNRYAKRHLRFQDRTVLATSGLISPGKGIEYAIKSLFYLVKERPDLLYLVLGETHPEVRRHEGEAYREKLIAMTKRLKLERHVRFIDSYLRDDQLSLYLQAVDIYLAPYLGKEQVSSGTVTLALGHGKAVVSTPTIFAKEVLSGDRGLLCKFADARSIAACVERILSEPQLRKRLEANAFKYGLGVGWTKVADQYGEIFRSAMQPRGALSKAITISET